MMIEDLTFEIRYFWDNQLGLLRRIGLITQCWELESKILHLKLIYFNQSGRIKKYNLRNNTTKQ